MIRSALLAALIGCLSSPVAAQMTICTGDSCAEEYANGSKRELSASEVGKMKRGNARTAIGNIECEHATYPQRCEHMVRTLHGLFPY